MLVKPLNLCELSDITQLTLQEIATSKTKGQRGYTRLSESQIRRLEERGLFPKSRRINGTRCRFYVAGEVKEWLTKQAANQEA
jgi:predicted DNA-binding transcriptional regulator AlpA